MNVSLYHIRLKSLFNVFVIIFLSLLTGILTLYGFGFFIAGFCIFILLCLYLKKVENIFLMWLLVFPLFNVDSLSFLIIDTHPILTFDRIVIGALFLFVLIQVVMGRRRLLPLNKLEIAMILFSVVIIYSVISLSVDKISGTRVFIDSFLYPFIIYFLARNLISDEKNFNKFINVIVIVGIYLSLMGIYEFFTGIDIFPFREGIVERSGYSRVNGPYKLDTAFGVNVAICFFIVLYKYITYNKNNGIMNIRRNYYILILGLLIFALFVNLYRGIWLALIVGLLAWIFIRRKGLYKLTFSIIILSAIVMLNFETIKSTKLFQERLSNTETFQSRFDKFDFAINLFNKNPIKGIGFNNYRPIGGSQHNTLLGFLSETGIIGVSVLMILIWFLSYYGLKNFKLSRDYLSKEFSIIFLCISITFLVTWMGQNSGFVPSINKLYFAIAGVSYCSPLIDRILIKNPALENITKQKI